MDFEKAFDDFCNVDTGGTSNIESMRKLFNTELTDSKLQLLHQLEYYAKKWECLDLLDFCNKYKADLELKGIKQGLFGTTLRACIKTQSLEEFLGKINSSSVKKVE